MVNYSESGVDINLEEVTVAKLAEKLKPTLKYRDIITESGHFAALVKMGNRAIAMSTDGVGSKILVAKMMEKYDTVGIDCIAMVVNDILCVGAEPIALVDYLAVEEPNPEIAEEIAKGLAEGAELSKIAIIGGETASLPEIVNDFDLAGTGIGFVDIDKIITGESIVEDDVLIGIRSSGIHSNGLSLARKALLENHKFKVTDSLLDNSEITIGEELLRPTELYVEPIVNLLKEDFDIKGLAHITGGGFTNLKRLNKEVGFDIYNLPEPQEIFKLIYNQNVPLEEMYKVFNMGIGFVVVAKEKDTEKILNTLNKYCESYKIGKVTSNSNEIKIKTFENTEIIY
ncbi:phosphoribosylformylglycinamidine cyclo-ligase [Methanobrevibacter sp. TMH8]|uniref:phosphoribosylformylglycinamidine cyclo-ligase n=1 Tax=Methanobrevibacter sp. TMH8 TaxID=2848611 RepID=UPI001CCC5386|nr:phosphoribosylformylglycinamidine cyclo-ligase [Methanobrevibacter sp. TMH8]MBZ9571417.1 phosphoribosylformylglycinamidine cyclo-ligase [Methanobrevibacter sp. TMH8]